MTLPFDRRGALALLAGGAAAAGLDAPAWAKPARPMLATPQQLAAERQLLALNRDARVIALKSSIRAGLLTGPIGRTADGAKTVARAVDLWTNSLIIAELTKYRAKPEFLWGTDDTPRRWYGHEFAVGTSGDNPDAIYRTAIIDGSRAYELTGRIDPANPATQLVIEIDAADMADPSSMMDMNGKMPNVESVTLAILRSDAMGLKPGDSFRITLGGEGSGPNHVKLRPGVITAGTRDILSDWRQRPAALAIRELGAKPSPAFAPLSAAAMRDQVLADLPGFIKFWANFPNIWFGGLKPNTHSAPMGRVGGWGFVAGLRYDLQPDEAMLVTTHNGGAHYTGFQLNDPWMIQPDARRFQVCLNNSQTLWNADGTASYVIAARDPGLANWLDPAGTSSGLGILRWQAVPPGLTKDGLIRELRVVKLADLAQMPLPRVTPAQRRAAIARRAWDFASRTRA
jgi:hypothetical protein